MLRGRTFDTRDTATSPRVAIINDALAKKMFPNRDALGAQMRLDNENGPVVQIVGIAKTGIYLYWAEPPQPFMWRPFDTGLRSAGDAARSHAGRSDCDGWRDSRCGARN